MSVTIKVDKKTVSEKIGIWFLASQLLEEHKIDNTGINQYHLYLWVKEYNKDCLEGDFIRKDSTLNLPSEKKDVFNICRTKLKINENKEQVLDNDFCLEFKFNKIIYHTTRTKLCDKYGNTAEDLATDDFEGPELIIYPNEEYVTLGSYGEYLVKKKFGMEASMNKERKEIIKMSFESYKDKSSDKLFELFKKGTEKFTKKGLRQDVYSMVDKFKTNKNIEDEFCTENIQAAANKHKTTIDLLNRLKDGLNDGVKHYKGDIEEFSKKILEQEEEISKCENDIQKTNATLERLNKSDGFCLWKVMHFQENDDKTKPHDDRTPWFSTSDDQESGLKIAINDVWAYDAELSKFKISKKEFQYHLKVIFYDHFGLDAHDVKKFGATDDTFKIWYYLQHSKRFNGMYKPFITKWIYEDDIKGEL